MTRCCSGQRVRVTPFFRGPCGFLVVKENCLPINVSVRDARIDCRIWQLKARRRQPIQLPCRQPCGAMESNYQRKERHCKKWQWLRLFFGAAIRRDS